MSGCNLQMPTKYTVEDAPTEYTVEDAPAAHALPSQTTMDSDFIKRMKAMRRSDKPAPTWEGYDQSFGIENEITHASPILGAVGGLVGSLGGPAGAVVGATYGGYLGKGIERDFEGKPRSALAEAGGGLEQGAYEAAGQIGGRVLWRLARPVLEKFPDLVEVLGLEKTSPKAVGHLTAAAASKGQAGPAKEAIAATIGDIEKTMEGLPKEQHTVEGFLDAVTMKRNLLHQEYANAIGPYARQEANTTQIVRNLEDLKKDWMTAVTSGRPEGAAELAAINAAEVRFAQPRTVGQLDSLRQQLNSDLSAFYNKAPNARYAAENGNINLAIDAAIARGARDTLYPIADRAAGKPEGYFADVLKREGHLIQLRGLLEKRVSDLAGSQAISEVTPRLSSENLSLSAHPGTMPRAGLYGLRQVFTPTRELAQASTHVRKAFQPQLNMLPYGVLFSDILRFREAVPKGPKTQQLEQDADYYRTHAR